MVSFSRLAVWFSELSGFFIVAVGVTPAPTVGIVAGVACGVGALLGTGVSVGAGVAAAGVLTVGVTGIVGVMATVGVTVASKGQNVCVGVLATAEGVGEGVSGGTAFCCTDAGCWLTLVVAVMVMAGVIEAVGGVGTRGGTLASTRGRSATAATLGIDCKFFIEFVDNGSICCGIRV